MRSPIFAAALLATVVLSPAVLAQDKGDAKKASEKADEKSDEKKDGASDTTAPSTATPATTTATEADPKPTNPNDPAEDPGKTYYFVGLRFRETILPKFMLNLFVAGGPSTVGIPSFGIEGGTRKDGFDTIFHLTYADWSMKEFSFKGKDEAPVAWERVTSDLKLFTLGVDLLWSKDIDKMFAFQYGMTVGIALVTGDLKRVQGQPRPGGNPDNPDDIVPCPADASGQGPATPSAYCGRENNHYGNYTESSWFNGGKKPNIYASFGPQVAFRIKPIKQFVGRVFLGWDLFSGPFFGLAGNYGI